MPEAKQITFTYQEVAEMMIERLGVSEGLWGVYINFGIQGANIGPNSSDLKPSAIVPVLEIGLQRFEEPSNLTVDAAKVVKAAPAKRKRAGTAISA